MSDGTGPLGVSDEVRQARDNADVGLGTDVHQRLRKGLPVPAEQHLAGLDQGARTTGVPIDILANVGVADDGEEKKRHSGTISDQFL